MQKTTKRKKDKKEIEAILEDIEAELDDIENRKRDYGDIEARRLTKNAKTRRRRWKNILKSIGTEKQIKISKIVNRAAKLKLLQFDKAALIMDLDAALHTFNIDLDQLLNFDNFNFGHDIIEIQRHIERGNAPLGKHWETPFKKCFLPRCARPKT